MATADSRIESARHSHPPCCTRIRLLSLSMTHLPNALFHSLSLHHAHSASIHNTHCGGIMKMQRGEKRERIQRSILYIMFRHTHSKLEWEFGALGNMVYISDWKDTQQQTEHKSDLRLLIWSISKTCEYYWNCNL